VFDAHKTGGIMKDFKKVAQFPGFRKGTIPPFMLPKVKEFTILRCLEKTLTLVRGCLRSACVCVVSGEW